MSAPAPGQPATSVPLVRRTQEGEAIWFLGNLVTLKATAEETRGRLTVAEFVNPLGFAPPLHRHLEEDEMFYVLDGEARFTCGDVVLSAGPGDFVLLPVGIPHGFVVVGDHALRVLQLTTPAGFEDFARAVGTPAAGRRLPGPEEGAPFDPVALGHAAATHGIEVLGPPPSAIGLAP